ncbi:MAG: hypothetical protein QNL91_00415 [Candidatus Krumholzibacteria bacterium]|nr:hypothetical protein [Candidatus Krumholzibacteria bacterium]
MTIGLARTRFFFVIFAVFFLVTSAVADDNRLGLFYDASASVNEVEIAPNSTHMLYLILLDPVNDSFDDGGSRDVEFVSGFECAIEPPNGDMLLTVTFPIPAINLGGTDNIVAGYVSAVPVSSGRAATLATFSVLTMGNSPVGYKLVPASPASHPNTMAYVDYEDSGDKLVDMAPASGSHDLPVFTFGDYTGEQNAKWGAVKSLYR